MRILFVLLLFFNQSLLANEDIGHLQVKVKKGDVLYRILLKYQLHNSACNVDAFYRINQMKKGAPILADKTYQLPIKVYNYNSESIRSTIGNNDWDLAVAIQDYNKILRNKNVKKYYMDDKILYVPYHLVDCDKIVIPKATEETVVDEKKKIVETDIYFGNNVKIEQQSDELSNQVFYIISGHGGPDPGAMGKAFGHRLCEDEYAYDVSLRLAKLLLENGATVHMIIQDPNDGIRDGQYLSHDHDEVCKLKGKIPLNQVKRLKQRSQAVNQLYKKEDKKKIHKVISIHIDSRSQSTKQDVFFYYAPGSKSGKKLATNLQNTFKKKYEIHQKGRGYSGSVSSRNLYVLRQTKPTAVFVELANIQNTNNHKRILPSNNREVLAKWLYEGLVE